MTTTILPPPVAVTAESVHAGHSVWAKTGRCSRNHDITDPDNVHVHICTDGRRQLSCLKCRRLRDVVRRQTYKPANYPALTCRQCGNEFTKPATLEITLRGWYKREFCSDACKLLATAARKTVTAGIGSADVDWSLAACDGVVQTADDDVFFPPDGDKLGRPTSARTVLARAYCQDCPIVAGCLQYAIDRDIRDGVWGGLDAGERKAIVKQFKAGAS